KKIEVISKSPHLTLKKIENCCGSRVAPKK
ncbi:unnamed protein product, partial [Oikopleura dioica]